MRPADVAVRIAVRHRSPHDELHWVPRAGGRASSRSASRTAAVDRGLGCRDWAEVDPAPVRTSKGVRHHFTGALYYWQRTRSHVWCESQAERWEVLWLDYGGQVERLWSQPFAVAFGHASPLSGHWHVPDFLARFTDGSYGLFDVRPADRIDDRADAQFAETARVCGRLGWHYRVLAGHDRLATQNLDCVSASRHDRCRPPAGAERLILDAAVGGRPRGWLCRAASPDCPPLACAWVDNLAWRRLLRVDLAGVFSSGTVYTTADPARDGREAAHA